jgi:mxaA protein
MSAQAMCWILPALLAAASGTAMAQVRPVTWQDSRAFGYFIGDEITLQTRIVVDEPFQLLDASLPLPGPIAYWLDLKSVSHHEQRRRTGERIYELRLTYQTFYAPLGTRGLEIPGFTLVLSNGSRQVETRVPTWKFVMSALRDIRPMREVDSPLMQADIGPVPAPSTLSRYALAAFAFMSVTTGVLLARYYACWPFARRPQRPFARAARLAKRALARSPRHEDYLNALRSMHRAFDATARRRVLPDDVKQFVQQAPAFASLQPEIERFFGASRSVFFGDNRADSKVEARAAQELIAFSIRMAALERRSK